MFTGLVEADGRLHSRTLDGDAGKLVIASDWAETLEVSESLAVNGTCLTIEALDGERGLIEFHVLAETLHKTNLGEVAPGRLVNLERALRMGDRLGGHMVMGHVDCTAELLDLREEEEDRVIEVALPEEQKPFIIPKGSIAVDGISLTVAKLLRDSFTVHIIPYTWEHTNLQEREPGEPVNLEMDMIGKYILRYEQLKLESAAD